MNPVPELIGESAGIIAVREQLVRLLEHPLASRRLPAMLIQGETGTGKGLLARAIHRASARGRGPFVEVECAAIPEGLLEAELFGFERGAFTDASRSKPGLFQTAHGGTVFLDEIGLLPRGLQAKLLKVVEEQAVRRLGSTRREAVDVQVVSATNEDLRAAVDEGRFRADLYHRLAALTVSLPPLRARGEDVLLLAEFFLSRACAEFGLPRKSLSPDARAALLAYSWPGNVRELVNVMERAALLCPDAIACSETLGLPGQELVQLADTPGSASALKESVGRFERSRLSRALEEAHGNISGAARRLGIPRQTLRYRLSKYGLGARPRTAPQRGDEASPRSPRQCANESLTTLDCRRRYLAMLQVTGVPREDSSAAIRLRELIRERVVSFGGTIQENGRSDVLAIFGIEPAEDAADRAAFAALAVVKATRKVDAEGLLPIGIGLHVGPVGVHRAGPESRLDTVDAQSAGTVLDRLATMVGRHAVIVSAGAARFLRRRFTLESCGQGVGGDGPYRLLGPAFERSGRLAAVTARFVGRHLELGVLESALARVAAGQGQVIGVIGEPGIGKSRLLDEFRLNAEARHARFLEGRCVAYGSAIPYLPLRDILQDAFGIDEDDPPEAVADILAAQLGALALDPEELSPYLLRMQGIQRGTERVQSLSPQAVKSRTFEALRQVLLAMSRQRALVVAVEDVQWIDRSSEEFLFAFADGLGAARVLLLSTYRSGYRPPWLERSYASQIAVGALGPADSRSIAVSILRDASLPDGLEETIVAKADGNPFFLEELAQVVLDRRGQDAGDAVPDTIEGVLAARIDRLDDELRAVLQAASVLGRGFSLTLLAAVWNGAGPLERHVRELCRLEFLHEQPSPGGRAFAFKHALTQEVAYGRLPLHGRETFHACAGQALEALFADRLEEQYELLGYHYSRSGDGDKAVDYLHRANQKAAAANAMVEAKACFDEAMRLLDALPEPKANHHRRISLIVDQGTVMLLLFRLPEYHDLLLRYRPLAIALDDAGLLGAFYVRLGQCELIACDLDAALRTLTQAAELCERGGNTQDAAFAYHRLQCTHLYLGNFEKVLRLKTAILGKMEQAFNLRWYTMALSTASAAETLLGRWDAALEDGLEALRVARKFSDDSLSSNAAMMTARAVARKGDLAQALEYARLAVETAPTPFDTAATRTTLASVLSENGDHAEGARLLVDVVSTYRRAGFTSYLVQALLYLGQTWTRAGQSGQARTALDECLAIAERSGARFYAGAAHRLLGEVRARAGEFEAATCHFETSIRVLRELDAARELALAYGGYGRLRRRAGDRAGAGDCLGRALEIFERLGALHEVRTLREEISALPPA